MPKLSRYLKDPPTGRRVSLASKLARLGVHLLYAPDAAEMYPEGFATTVSVSGLSKGLRGAFRPTHFDGVATVVTKLFLQTGVASLGRPPISLQSRRPAIPGQAGVS